MNVDIKLKHTALPKIDKIKVRLETKEEANDLIKWLAYHCNLWHNNSKLGQISSYITESESYINEGWWVTISTNVYPMVYERYESYLYHGDPLGIHFELDLRDFKQCCLEITENEPILDWKHLYGWYEQSELYSK